MRSLDKQLLLGLLFLVFSVTTVTAQPLYVPVQQGDCINTFTVRLMVEASNTGSAWGEFEGSRIMIIRKGTSPQRCWLEMGQWAQDGRLIESKRLQCLFGNPLG